MKNLCKFFFTFTLCTAAKAELIPYQLPVQFMCNAKWYTAFGGFVCSQWEDFQAKIKVSIPQSRGKFRITNCNRDLTEDGNPDDFNNTTWESGFWFWRRKHVVFSGHPMFETHFLSKNDSNCAIVITVAAENTGVQKALFVTRVGTRSDEQAFLEYTCQDKVYNTKDGNQNTNGNGVGYCKALSGGAVKFVVHSKWDNGVLAIKSTNCGIEKIIKFTNTENSLPATNNYKVKIPVDIKVQPIVCNFDFRISSLGEKPEAALVVVVGTSRDRSELDNPVFSFSGNKLELFKPIGATAMNAEVYKNNLIIWRSGLSKDEKIVIEKEDGNKVCANAYNAGNNSMSSSCYSINPLKEISYEFN